MGVLDEIGFSCSAVPTLTGRCSRHRSTAKSNTLLQLSTARNTAAMESYAINTETVSFNQRTTKLTKLQICPP